MLMHCSRLLRRGAVCALLLVVARLISSSLVLDSIPPMQQYFRVVRGQSKGNALPAPKGASARNAVPPGTKAADADASAGRRRRKGRSAPGPEAGQVP